MNILAYPSLILLPFCHGYLLYTSSLLVFIISAIFMKWDPGMQWFLLLTAIITYRPTLTWGFVMNKMRYGLSWMLFWGDWWSDFAPKESFTIRSTGIRAWIITCIDLVSIYFLIHAQTSVAAGARVWICNCIPLIYKNVIPYSCQTLSYGLAYHPWSNICTNVIIYSRAHSTVMFSSFQ